MHFLFSLHAVFSFAHRIFGMDNQTEKMLRCSGCGKNYSEESILRHINHHKNKTCKKKYTLEELDALTEARDGATKKRKADYYTANKEKISKKNDANKEAIRKRNVDYYAANKEAIRKKNVDYHAANKDKISKKNADYYAANKDKVSKKNAGNKEAIRKRNADYHAANKEQIQKKKKVRKSNTSTSDRVLAFKRDVIDGPNFDCFSCERSLFKRQVKILKMEDILVLYDKMDESLVAETGLSELPGTTLILCHNCLKVLNANKFPSMNFNNSLQLDRLPPEIADLADLEQQMIAKTIFFIKIKRLTHGMRAAYDQVVCVPIETADVENNLSKFPRHPKDSEIVAVKLRRKLEYKSVVLQEYVRPQVRILFVYHIWFLGCIKINIFRSRLLSMQ